MSKSHATRTAVRNAVIRGLTLEEAAVEAKVGYSTARRWKVEAEQQGDDWYRIRDLSAISPSEISASQQGVLKRAIEAYEATLNAITQDQSMPAVQKAEVLAELIVKLGAIRVSRVRSK
ncbi:MULTISPECIES: DUF1804 family protein [Burkholderia cepacia complex]|uniref:DUF1804 family protein n=1 Tax=Burkholderia cepacia complex TaxID=87882 RepID=UPI0019058507|nr:MULTISPECIES: DUF1804 family protein [Burkholderia cepacia complex]MBJ9754707.1 DUF1804 family protein [Burkholderia cepacia]MBR7899453.1 DUF1804 family protein [Burkholderia multivorans]HEM8498367.1 DUF1804 family protein [Burkholderia multivorans]